MQYKKDFCEFEPWGQAREIYEKIEEEGKLDELESLLEEMYQEKLPTETEINDLLAYDWEWVYESLGIKEEDEEEDEEEEDEEDEEEDEEEEDEEDEEDEEEK